MLHRPWTPADAALGPPAWATGESLQADVMRFLAILGMCLMAIFALVQSVAPTSSPTTTNSPNRSEPTPAPTTGVEDLRDDVRAPNLEPPAARQLRDATVDEARAPQMAADDANQRLAQIRDADRRQLARPASLRRATPSAGNRAEADEQGDGQSTKTEETARAPQPPRPPAMRQGFILRFASDEALRALIASNAVSLYAVDDTSAWRVRISRDAARLESTPRPRSMHVMEPDTVPASLGALYAAEGVVWGVRLPHPIRRQVADLTRAAPGGTLTIDERGRVELTSRPGPR